MEKEMRLYGLTAWSALLLFFLIILPYPLHSQEFEPVTKPDICNQSLHMSRSHAIEAFNALLAVCGSRQPIGTNEFIEYWMDIASICAEGNEPVELWDRLLNTPIFNVNGFYHMTSCEHIVEIFDNFDIPLDGQYIINKREDSKNNKTKAHELLVENAASGSPPARFLLATVLLDIENFSQSYRSGSINPALDLFSELVDNLQHLIPLH